MQAAVDCNGSSSSSSSGSFTISTVTTITQSEMLAAPEGSMPTTMTLTTDEAPHILGGRRLPMVKVPKESDVDAAFIATPSTSPHASPSRKQSPAAGKDSLETNKDGDQLARECTASFVVKLLPLLPHTDQTLCSGIEEVDKAASTPMKSCLPTPTTTGSASNSPQSSSASSPAPLTPISCATTTASSQCSTPGTSSASSASAAPLASPTAPVMAHTSFQTSTLSPIAPLKSKSSLELELLQWQDMPQYLQFNPYVLKGYRPLQTFKGCMLSLFYWHNETINILTHAIPIVYILAIVPGLMPWENGYRFLSFCHVFGSVAPWCGSFVYHLFMNIERGENVYYNLLKLDMVGIWVSQSFGALPLVTATTHCFNYRWKWLIIISYCLMCLWGLYKALTACSPWQRRLCFALPFTMRSILTLLRTVGTVGGNRVALPHVYLQDGVSVLGGAIGAMRIPEKWFPGLVDFYLNSHNIMHVLVVIAVYSMHKATIKDFEWMSTTTCGAFANGTSSTIDDTIAANIEL